MRKMLSLFLLVFLIFSIFTYSFVDINLSYLSLIYTGLYLNQRIVLTTIYTVIIFILFGLSYFLLNNIDKDQINFQKLILLILIASVFSYPAILTFDIFNYITTARVTFLYQENPYIVYPIELMNDPYLAFTRAANKTALYGPFWILLTGIPFILGFGNFIMTLFSFKLFIAFFYLATAFLIRKIDKNAVWFFALNPLVIIESLVSSHNDIVMIFFALLSLYLFFNKKHLSSIFSILASILIKPATIFLAPVYFGMIKDKFINKIINRSRIFAFCAGFMLIIFVLSPLREELYPWYAIWFIAFTSFLYKNRFLQNLVLVFSLGLVLRYVPYMATGNYFGLTPIIRNVLMVLPVAIFLFCSALRNKFKFI